MAEPGETIAAVATPGGRGGIGIIRISGIRAAALGAALGGDLPPPRHARHAAFRAADGTPIDRGLLIYFPAPASYTGEDVVELHGHGGRAVLELLLERVLELGARHARPGEFTERAFLNGKLDLVQAEAVADLIDSASRAGARGAMRSLEGEFSQRIRALQAELVALRVQIEGALDFPEEDAGFTAPAAGATGCAEWCRNADTLLARARNGRRLRAGLRVVILGPPNAGKSSLLNLLAASERAIVHATPGTTRDTLEESVLLDGGVLHVVDTAGLRETADPVEAEGIRRALAAAAAADLLLLVTDAAAATAAFEPLLPRLPPGVPRLIVRNKIDLCGQRAARTADAETPTIALSAKTGAGVELLRAALAQAAGTDAAAEDAILARERHIQAMERARAAVQRAGTRLGPGGGVELAAEELRAAQAELGRITGEFGADDLLGEIFARFCIGK